MTVEKNKSVKQQDAAQLIFMLKGVIAFFFFKPLWCFFKLLKSKYSRLSVYELLIKKERKEAFFF